MELREKFILANSDQWVEQESNLKLKSKYNYFDKASSV